MEPARAIVTMLGGPKIVADFFGVSVGAITKWYVSAQKGGCDGVIPAKRVAGLLELARKQGKFLEPNMLYPPKTAR
jgi:hypothetical protein